MEYEPSEGSTRRVNPKFETSLLTSDLRGVRREEELGFSKIARFISHISQRRIELVSCFVFALWNQPRGVRRAEFHGAGISNLRLLY